MIIGWQEWVTLPDLHGAHVNAKIDTGADTSSLHAYNIKRFRRDNQRWVRFEIHPLAHRSDIILPCEAPILNRRVIRSSGGEREKRPVILTRLILGERELDIELNLTNRDYMGCLMLLGRQALQQDVLIDPSKTYLLTAFKDLTA